VPGPEPLSPQHSGHAGRCLSGGSCVFRGSWPNQRLGLQPSWPPLPDLVQSIGGRSPDNGQSQGCQRSSTHSPRCSRAPHAPPQFAHGKDADAGDVYFLLAGRMTVQRWHHHPGRPEAARRRGRARPWRGQQLVVSQRQLYLPVNYKCNRETRSAPSRWQQCPRGRRKNFGGSMSSTWAASWTWTRPSPRPRSRGFIVRLPSLGRTQPERGH